MMSQSIPSGSSYALTYPQLMNQALAAGRSDAELAALRSAVEFARELFSGYYRAQGVPFICHVVRAASIVLAAGGPLATINAALLHNAYVNGRFDDKKAGKFSDKHRRQMRERAGEAVENLVFIYSQFPWYEAGALEKHLESFGRYSAAEKEVIVMRLANEIEDHLDLALGYSEKGSMAGRGAAFHTAMIALAEAVGQPGWAKELAGLYEAYASARLPAFLKFTHRSTFSEK